MIVPGKVLFVDYSPDQPDAGGYQTQYARELANDAPVTPGRSAVEINQLKSGELHSWSISIYQAPNSSV